MQLAARHRQGAQASLHRKNRRSGVSDDDDESARDGFTSGARRESQEPTHCQTRNTSLASEVVSTLNGGSKLPHDLESTLLNSSDGQPPGAGQAVKVPLLDANEKCSGE